MIETCSSLQVHMDCRKKYEYKYIDRLEPNTYNRNLGLGCLTHAYAEGADRLEEEYRSFLDRYPNSETEISVDRYKAEKMINAHDLFYDSKDKEDPRANDNLTDWRREVEWKFPLGTDMQLAGKSDGLVTHPKYGVCLYELKTSGMLYKQEEYIYQLDNNLQIDMNMIAHGVTTVVYDIIFKPQVKQRKNPTKKLPAESDMEFAERWGEQFMIEPARYFTRVFITRTPEQLQRSVNETVDRVVNANSGVVYRNQGNCFKFNTKCEFFEMCVDNLEPEGWSKRARKFPELSEEIQGE